MRVFAQRYKTNLCEKKYFITLLHSGGSTGTEDLVMGVMQLSSYKRCWLVCHISVLKAVSELDVIIIVLEIALFFKI